MYFSFAQQKNRHSLTLIILCATKPHDKWFLRTMGSTENSLIIVDRTHYNDVTMGAMASQITSFTIVYKRLFRRISKKTSKLRVTSLCEWNFPVTGEFPAQRASNAENVSIWWRHHYYNGACHVAAIIETTSQLSRIHLQIGHPSISSTGARFSTELW